MTTAIQIVSDLHIEYKNDDIPDPLNYITPTANILVLAGDIGNLYKVEQLEGFLKKLCPLFETVIYVPGNQEYYMSPNIPTMPMIKLTSRLYEIEKNIENLYILDQSSVVIGDICICGCTLWSKPMVNIPKYIVRINGINNDLYEKKFRSDLSYIDKMIEYCTENKFKLFVVTHYCPTYSIVDDDRVKDKYISLYVTELDYLLHKDKVHTWCCGHIHRNFDIMTPGGTRVVGNQKGKPKDNITDFRKDFVIQI